MKGMKRIRADLVVIPTHQTIPITLHLAEAKTFVSVIHAYLIQTMILLHSMSLKQRPHHHHRVYSHVLKP